MIVKMEPISTFLEIGPRVSLKIVTGDRVEAVNNSLPVLLLTCVSVHRYYGVHRGEWASCRQVCVSVELHQVRTHFVNSVGVYPARPQPMAVLLSRSRFLGSWSLHAMNLWTMKLKYRRLCTGTFPDFHKSSASPPCLPFDESQSLDV